MHDIPLYKSQEIKTQCHVSVTKNCATTRHL